jgi:hypothetical protein
MQSILFERRRFPRRSEGAWRSFGLLASIEIDIVK